MQKKNPLSSASLRTRLLVGVLLLSALGFLVSDLVAQNAMQKFLVEQVDDQLLSVADGALMRVDRAGIQDDDDDDDDIAKSAAPAPLRSVPSSVSITLLDPFGNYVGGVGGDLNAQKITDYVLGTLPARAAEYGNKPFTLEVPGSDFRVLARVLPSAMGSVFVAQSLSGVDETSKRLRLIFVFIGLIALLLIALASRIVIKIGLRPLADVEDVAEKIADGDLSARLPDAKPDTEVGRLVSSLNAMLSRIEESFAARAESESKLRRFVADASHELRTPLTAIRGFAELHRQGAVKGEAATSELVGRIENESVRMGAFVEDLLMLARLDQSRELVSEPVNLNEVVTESVESARAAGPEHPISIDLPDEAFVLGDAGKIYQVVANLLANARIHTPIGTPIAVSVKSDDAGTTISITDSGPGLSQADQDRIFERFYRADPSRNRSNEEGSGLGLSIVDAVMQAHGGKVTVTSKLGEGATFTVFFPLAAN
ncbi:BaeS Signal transduction histidine kinase [Candidatus Nanopelagicaceae bacterium]